MRLAAFIAIVLGLTSLGISINYDTDIYTTGENQRVARYWDPIENNDVGGE